MKKTAILLSLALASLAGFSQKKVPLLPHPTENPWPKKDTPAVSHVPTSKSAVPTMYALILTQEDKDALYAYILEADVYSDKGKQNFLRNLDLKMRLLSVSADSTKK